VYEFACEVLTTGAVVAKVNELPVPPPVIPEPFVIVIEPPPHAANSHAEPVYCKHCADPGSDGRALLRIPVTCCELFDPDRSPAAVNVVLPVPRPAGATHRDTLQGVVVLQVTPGADTAVDAAVNPILSGPSVVEQ
jgi:hypothetical protein